MAREVEMQILSPAGERHLRLALYHHALEDQMNDYILAPHETYGLLDAIRIHDSPHENVKIRDVA